MADQLRNRPLGERLAELLRKQILMVPLHPASRLGRKLLPRSTKYPASRFVKLCRIWNATDLSL